MTELGVGVRCWAGWVPDDDISDMLITNFDPRCKIAVILEGPLFTYPDSVTDWRIRFEDDGERCIATSNVLYPIDDWDEDLTEKRTDKIGEPA